MSGMKFSASTLAFSLALGIAALPAAPAAADEMADQEVNEMTPAGDVHYETSDPIDSPPVNYRSDVDEEFATPETHDAEMYAEEYERQKREEKMRNKTQLDRIQDFTSGAITTDGVTPTDSFGR